RVLLLGGVPFGEPILMWWNFVARTREEITGAYAQWKAEDGRFGEVHSRLDRIPAPPPPWTR
ncbi:MAG TPA: pirin-like C-terminal cupin domain-containing protein, partial [Mycobacteriales bacterium]|nr:pirin-like C-terminal cupin domain-containing protein [Mycobacteriales bacterium]